MKRENGKIRKTSNRNDTDMSTKLDVCWHLTFDVEPVFK